MEHLTKKFDEKNEPENGLITTIRPAKENSFPLSLCTPTNLVLNPFANLHELKENKNVTLHKV